jgi:hypothetical protein
VQLLDDYLDYAVDALTRVPCPVKVIARLSNQQVSGTLDAVEVDSRGRATVDIDGQRYPVRDFLAFRLATTGAPFQ